MKLNRAVARGQSRTWLSSLCRAHLGSLSWAYAAHGETGWSMAWILFNRKNPGAFLTAGRLR
jgi:hypothetical protein